MNEVYRITRSTNRRHYGNDNNGTITINEDRTNIIFYTEVEVGGNWQMLRENDTLNSDGDDIHYNSNTGNYQWDFAFINGTSEAIRAYIASPRSNPILVAEAKKITVHEADRGNIFLLFSVENLPTPEEPMSRGPGGGTGAGIKP